MKKEKMEQVSFCAFGDGDSRITSVWLRREKVRKKKMQKPSQCIYGAQSCMKNMRHTSRNSFRISTLNL